MTFMLSLLLVASSFWSPESGIASGPMGSGYSASASGSGGGGGPILLTSVPGPGGGPGWSPPLIPLQPASPAMPVGAGGFPGSTSAQGGICKPD